VRSLGRYWLALTLVAAGIATSVVLYPRLPAIIPIHWNAAGVINGWMPKSEGAFIGPGLALVITLFLILIEPVPTPATQAGDDRESLARYYPTIVAAVAGICLYATVGVLMAGMGWHVDMTSHAAIGLGLLMVVTGNSLRNVPRNGVVGVRTPWTRANEAVWRRTHRLARWLFVLAGVVAAVAGLMGEKLAPGLIAIGAAAAISVAYSYVIWRRLDGGNGGSA
jgi:immunity protein, SdpI family